MSEGPNRWLYILALVAIAAFIAVFIAAALYVGSRSFHFFFG